MKSLLWILVFLCTSDEILGKRILLVPFQFSSHFLELNAISSGLLAHGHEVYTIISRSFDSIERYSQDGIKPLFIDSYLSAKSIDDVSRETFEKGNLYYQSETSRLSYEDCYAMLQDKKLNEDIARIKFDLAIVDGFIMSYCGFLIPYVHDIPYVSMFGMIHPWATGTNVLLFFNPLSQGASFLFDEMIYHQQLENLLWYMALIENLYFRYPSFLHEYAPEVPSWEALAYKSLLFIETRNFVLEKPSATLPNFIQTAGITAREAQSLSPELEDIMNQAQHGVVLVSFGSILDNFPEDITHKLITAFSQLNLIKLTVIWKYNGKVLNELSKNIHIFKWLPQNDLLGHPNTRVFVTHCGNNGQHEAVYHAVPMVGLPLCGEQHHNAFRIMDKGFGLSLIPGGLRNFSPSELFQAIVEVASNPKYKTAILEASAIMKDSPMDPVATCTYHLEHILKHGASHLGSRGIPWYQFSMLDILLFFLLRVMTIICVAVLMLMMITCVLSCCCCAVAGMQS